MNRREFLSASAAASALALAGCATTAAHTNTSRTAVYELRVYTINPGKAEALHNRFIHHTLPLFKKHGIESVAYWMPADPADQRLHFLLRYPSREAREASWKAFMADPAWQAAAKASEANGPLLAKPPENYFLQLTDYSPLPRTGVIPGAGVFELRTYTTPRGGLANIDARFRDHTIKLFNRHNIGNYAYWHRMADQPDASVTLQYLVYHKSKEAAKANFAAFGQDPDWKSAYAASEKAAGGSLTIPGGVKSVFLVPTPYSPTKAQM